MLETTAPVESEYTKVLVKYTADEYGKMFQWCLENCSGKFYNRHYTDTVHFFFDTEQDAVQFSLTWYQD